MYRPVPARLRGLPAPFKRPLKQRGRRPKVNNLQSLRFYACLIGPKWRYYAICSVCGVRRPFCGLCPLPISPERPPLFGLAARIVFGKETFIRYGRSINAKRTRHTKRRFGHDAALLQGDSASARRQGRFERPADSGPRGRRDPCAGGLRPSRSRYYYDLARTGQSFAPLQHA